MNVNLTVDLTSLAFWGGVPSTLFLFRYTVQLLCHKAPPTGLASFMMWTVLDTLLLVNTIRNGQPLWMPLGWVLGAGSVTVALCIRGTWHWTRRETLSLIGAVLAATVSMLTSGRWGLVASLTAMMAAGTPILIDNLKVPVRATFMVWFTTVIACILSLLGSDWSFDGTILPWASLVYNGAMSIIVLRKPARAAVATA